MLAITSKFMSCFVLNFKDTKPLRYASSGAGYNPFIIFHILIDNKKLKPRVREILNLISERGWHLCTSNMFAVCSGTMPPPLMNICLLAFSLLEMNRIVRPNRPEIAESRATEP